MYRNRSSIFRWAALELSVRGRPLRTHSTTILPTLSL